MADYDRPNVEKPYELIDFAASKAARSTPTGHHTLETTSLTGQLELYLIARTPVQVASGSFDIKQTKQGEEIVALGSTVQQYTEGNRPREHTVLPGSSLKGAVRSLVETISPSCVVTSSWNSRTATPRDLTRCTQIDALCPACRLFGMSGSGKDNYMGQVSIEDALLIDGGLAIVRTPLLWTPARGRGGLPGRYMAGRDAKGRKVYQHSRTAAGPDARVAIKSKSVLRTVIHFTNLTPGALGLLISGLGLHPQHRFLPKIGAGKPVGMGTVETIIGTATLDGDVAKSGRLGNAIQRYEDQALNERLAEWCKQAETDRLVVSKALAAVTETLKLANLKRPPLEGMY